jgi:xanthine dehydrogenase YagS FAD-binding subunit
MRPFRYHRAGTAVEAVAALAGEPGAKFLGGGTNLVDLMRLGVETPPLLVDVTKLPHDRVEGTAAGGVRIGAAVRNSDLAGNQLVRSRFPVLAEALLAGASGQLRNLATVGGNLMQRTRCAYFQDVTKACNKRAPGTGCPAREGEHHNHAILGHSEHCVATHPSDMAVALAALDAMVHVDHRGGRATIPLSGLYRLPGDEPHRDTVLAHGELITAVEVPPLPDGARSRYRKVRERASFSFAVVSVAAAVELDGGVVRRARLALGGVAHVPWRAAVAERALQGQRATRENFARGADAELAAARPLRDNGYKVTLARNLIVRTLSDLVEAGP